MSLPAPRLALKLEERWREKARAKQSAGAAVAREAKALLSPTLAKAEPPPPCLPLPPPAVEIRHAEAGAPKSVRPPAPPPPPKPAPKPPIAPVDTRKEVAKAARSNTHTPAPLLRPGITRGRTPEKKPRRWQMRKLGVSRGGGLPVTKVRNGFHGPVSVSRAADAADAARILINPLRARACGALTGKRAASAASAASGAYQGQADSGSFGS